MPFLFNEFKATIQIKGPLRRHRMSGFRRIVGPLWVVHARWSGGAGRQLYDLKPPFTPRWQVCVTERPLGRIASMPATGQTRSYGQVALSSHSMTPPTCPVIR